MIVRMAKVRFLGPSALLEQTLHALQDLALAHLTSPPGDDRLTQLEAPSRQARRERMLAEAARELDRVIAQLLGPPARLDAPPAGAGAAELLRWLRLARRIRKTLAALAEREAHLEEERALIAKYDGLFSAFGELLEGAASARQSRAYYLLVRAGESAALVELKRALRAALEDRFTLHTRTLTSGEEAVLLLIAASDAQAVERMMADAALHEMPARSQYGATLLEAIPAMRARARAIPGELREVREERKRLAREHGPELVAARAAIGDLAINLSARSLTRRTEYAFVLDGWVPAAELEHLRRALARAVGPQVVVELVAEEAWRKEDAPVVLSNPPLFRPFEAITRMLPLPRYGTIDPTPLVAVFFPSFFGLILGDLGYGALLVLLAVLLLRFSGPESKARAIAKIAGACALFTLIFGLLYGELFGDLGRRWFGLHAIAFDREEAIVPYLTLAIAVGLVHIVLGLGLGAASSFQSDKRKALGKGITALMVVLIAACILAAIEVLPRAILTPAVIALLVAFPLLIAAEGMTGAIELLSVVANILSYARIMALGTASVMMAVVANRIAGTMGSVVVGVLFALLFHLVNFALGLFSPTLHALRLHYVEFFGKFYSPGGLRYEPFGHWHASEHGPARAG